MFNDDEIKPASYLEDSFDLDEYKKTELVRAKDTSQEEEENRKISFYKLLIGIIAISLMFLLYHVVNRIIEHYDTIRYTTTSMASAIIDFFRAY